MKQDKSVSQPTVCWARQTLGDECQNAIAPGKRKYCAIHHKLASRLAKRRYRAEWRALGIKYWLDYALKISPSRAEYMRHWRRRAKSTTANSEPALIANRPSLTCE